MNYTVITIVELLYLFAPTGGIRTNHNIFVI